MGSFLQTIVKITLIFINFIVLVFGLLLAGSGIYAYIQYKDVDVARHFHLETSTTALITLGCIIIVISFSGFWGAIRRSQCLLVTFACFMILFIAAYGFSLYVITKGVGDFNYEKLKREMHKTFDASSRKEDNYELFVIEDLLHCCGTTGPSSYRTRFGLLRVPYTCCTEEHTDMNSFFKALTSLSEKDSNGLIPKDTCSILKAHKTGCLDAIFTSLDSIKDYITNVIIGNLIVVSLEFIGAVYLCSSKSSKQKHDRRSHY